MNKSIFDLNKQFENGSLSDDTSDGVFFEVG